jgi:sugar phosphate isomerase/epimerase
MILAAHTYAFRDMALRDALAAITGAGFDAVEVWLGHVQTDADLSSLREHQVEVVAVSAGGFYTSDAAHVRRASSIARVLGAQRLVACIPPALVTQLAVHVDRPLQLCLENHWDQPVARSRTMLEALEGAPSVGACLDTGHALLAGEYPDLYARRLGDRLSHIHLKDGRLPTIHERLLGRRARRRLLGRPFPVRPGAGDLDLSRFRAALDAVGYSGAVSLEHEGSDPASALVALRAAWHTAAQEVTSAGVASVKSTPSSTPPISSHSDAMLRSAEATSRDDSAR